MSAYLMVNSGSSSLKASLFREGQRRDFRYPQIGTGGAPTHEAAIHQLLKDLEGQPLDAIGHRMTHGGDSIDEARILDARERQRLTHLASLAPLHLPHNLKGVDLCQAFGVCQVACFDTAFHKTMPLISRRLPVPAACGVERVGFHGLNYGYIASRLPQLLPNDAEKLIAVAHLGNGSSLCLLQNRRSIDTTMGWTPLGGVPMGTRSGDLDPGCILHLLSSRETAEVENLLWRESGLLALSDGIGSQMEALLHSKEASASFAVNFYCRSICKAIGGFAASQGGLDALVFTGGIGENSNAVRAKICEPLKCLGFRLNPQANESAQALLSSEGSKPILRIAADEEKRMFELVQNTMKISFNLTK